MSSSSAADDRGTATNILCILFTTICAVLVSSRVYIRSRITKNFGCDDVLLLLSMALAIVTLSFVVIATAYGLGRHATQLTQYQQAQVIKYSVAFQIVEYSGVTFTRLSILVLILRLQNKAGNYSKGVVWCFLVASATAGALIAFYLSFQCYPLAKLWNHAIEGGYCSEPGAITIIGSIQTGTAIATDLFCSVMPIIILWKIQVPIRRKVHICTLMSLGLGATVCIIARVPYFKVMHMSSDYTYDIWPAVILTTLEFYLRLTAACLPVVVINFTKLRWKLSLSTIPSRIRTYMRVSNHGIQRSESPIANDKSQNCQDQQQFGKTGSTIITNNLRDRNQGQNSYWHNEDMSYQESIESFHFGNRTSHVSTTV